MNLCTSVEGILWDLRSLREILSRKDREGCKVIISNN